jgi:hypothetical protein
VATEIFPGTASSPNDDAPCAKTTSWGRGTLVKPVLYTFLGLGTAVPSILCVIFYLQMSEMGIRLNSLEAALRSGQLNQLSVSVTELEKHVAEQDLRFATNEKLDAGMQELSSRVDRNVASLSKENEGIRQQLVQDNNRFIELKSAFNQSLLRLDALSQLKEVFEKKNAEPPSGAASSQSRPANSPAKSKKSIRSAKSVPLAAPFILTGIEQRGGQRYAVVMRRGATTLSEMQLVAVGDSAWGWTLRDMQGHEAIFSVGGSQQRLSVQ